MRRLLTRDEAADLLQLHVATVDSWVKRGLIPVIRFGRRAVRFDPADLERVVASRKEGDMHDD